MSYRTFLDNFPAYSDKNIIIAGIFIMQDFCLFLWLLGMFR